MSIYRPYHIVNAIIRSGSEADDHLDLATAIGSERRLGPIGASPRRPRRLRRELPRWLKAARLVPVEAGSIRLLARAVGGVALHERDVEGIFHDCAVLMFPLDPGDEDPAV